MSDRQGTVKAGDITMSNNANILGAFNGLELVGPESLNMRIAGDNLTYND